MNDLEKMVNDYIEWLKSDDSSEDGQVDWKQCIYEAAIESVLGSNGFDIIREIIDAREAREAVEASTGVAEAIAEIPSKPGERIEDILSLTDEEILARFNRTPYRTLEYIHTGPPIRVSFTEEDFEENLRIEEERMRVGLTKSNE